LFVPGTPGGELFSIFSSLLKHEVLKLKLLVDYYCNTLYHASDIGKADMQNQNDKPIDTEKALRKSEMRFKSIVNASPMGIHMYELTDAGELIFIGSNPAAQRILGVDHAPFVGKRIEEAFPFLASTDVPSHYKAVARDGQPWKTEQIEYEGGEIRGVFEVLAFQTEPGKMAALFNDVSDRKRMMEALRESEYFFKESQRAANIGSYKLNFLTGVWEASEVLDSLFGIDGHYPKTIESWLALVYPNDRKMMDQYLKEEVIAKRNSFNKEYRIVRKSDGAVRWIHGLGKIVFDHNNTLETMTGTILDITDRKHAEIEREKLQNQLTQAQKMESVGRLAGGVAHDFNNMLGVILGYTELAMEKAPPLDPLHADLEEIQKAAQRSADLTRQLLAFASKQTVAPKVLDLNETVEGMLKILRRLIGENIALAWKPGHGLWPIRMDPTQIDQILANLCVNARDAISGAGKVTIETTNASFDAEDCDNHAAFLPGDYVLLAVSDNGCGMSPESTSHLFEPFFTTKEVGKGTGLGLASLYGAIKQNNGFVNVYSELGKGTTFKIYLPRDTAKKQAETKEPQPRIERGSETILLVEDEPAILRMTGIILEKLGYNVLAASSPSEALRLAREHNGRIHLLLTDVIMPDMQGYELAKNLQSLYPKMKCLFMSGYTAHSIARADLLTKDMHFIQKPFSKTDLGAKLREVLKK
jgi:signal transduction histidine kinase